LKVLKKNQQFDERVQIFDERIKIVDERKKDLMKTGISLTNEWG